MNAAALLALSTVLALPASAQPSVLLMFEGPSRASVSEALAVELAPRGHSVVAIDAPIGGTQIERAAAAQHAARELGARAVVWLERMRVCALGSESDELRQAPIASAADARTVALVAASLLDELLIPPHGGPEIIVEAESEGPVQLRVRMRAGDEEQAPIAREDADDALEHRRAPTVHVLAHRGREYVIALGQEHDETLGPGWAVELLAGPEPDAEVLALAEIVRVEPRRSVVRLMHGFRPAEAPTLARLAPWRARVVRLMRAPRYEGWRISLGLAPYLSVWDQDIGVGVVVEGELAYHLPGAPFVLAAELSPYAWAIDEQGTIQQAVVRGSVGLDFHAVGVTLGGGAILVNDHTVSPELSLGVRIGPMDGMRVVLRGGIAFGSPETVWPSALLFDFQAPVSRRGFWILMRGYAAAALYGSTLAGSARAETGFRALLTGDLGPGSVLLTITGGYVLQNHEDGADWNAMGGPTLAASLEVRP